jgi:beta-lactamase regulating signal transducer with metallopeptidase domain
VDRAAEAVVTFVVNAAWQSAVIALIGLAISRMLHRAPASLRFWLASLTLIAAVASPLMTLLPRSQPHLARAVFAQTTPDSLSLQPAPLPPLPPLRATVNRSVADIVTIIYFPGLLLAVARLGFAALRTRRLLSRSQPFADGIRISDGIVSPVTIGTTILIPRSLENSDLLPAAIAHERAHVRRRDFTVNAILQLIALPLWFHPLAMLLRRAIGELREQACDEEAAGQSSPQAYAMALVRIASMSARRDFALGMGSTSIERRVALLRTSPPRSRAATLAAIVAVISVPIALLAACSRTSIAPSISSPTLSGRWKLVPSQSDFRAMTPRAYESFTQSIAQDARGISVRQHRVAKGRAEDHAWCVVTDGRWRKIDGIRNATGRATWRNGQLSLCLKSPGAHTENVDARISDGKLIVDGATERGHYHTVFQRED